MQGLMPPAALPSAQEVDTTQHQLPPTCVSRYAVRVWSVVPHTGFSSRMGTA